MRATLKDLEATFDLTVEEASEHFGTCTTSLKHHARKLGIRRWPQRRFTQYHRIKTQCLQLPTHVGNLLLIENEELWRIYRANGYRNPNTSGYRLRLKNLGNRVKAAQRRQWLKETTINPLIIAVMEALLCE